MKSILIAVIISVVIIVGGVVGISAAPPPNAQEKISTHVTNDKAVRALQVFDISQVEKGSQITSTNAVFTLSNNIGDDCTLILNEPHLKKDEISDPFVCAIENVIPLKLIGIHALQSKLNSDNFNIEIKSITSGDILPIPSNSITLNISYLSPQYYAQIENNIVVNVILADQDHIDKLLGKWILTDSRTSKGMNYDITLDQFTSTQPYPSWTLDNNNGWIAPTPYPLDGLKHDWNEVQQVWD